MDYRHLFVEGIGESNFYIRCYYFIEKQIELYQAIITSKGGTSILVEGKVDDDNLCKDIGYVYTYEGESENAD